jgi:hypothetical protein
VSDELTSFGADDGFGGSEGNPLAGLFKRMLNDIRQQMVPNKK